MAWKIKTSKLERFLNRHASQWPINLLPIAKAVVKYRDISIEEQKAREARMRDSNESYIPEALNLNLMIHVEEIEKFKKLYVRLQSKHEKGDGIFDVRQIYSRFWDLPKTEWEGYSDTEGLKLKENTFFNHVYVSIIRVTESFAQLSFRFSFSTQFKEKFAATLIKKYEVYISVWDSRFSNMFRGKQRYRIYSDVHMMYHEVATLLDDSKLEAKRVLGKKIINLHIGSTTSAFSLFLFSYSTKAHVVNKEKKSALYGFNLEVESENFDKYSDNNRRILFFNQIGNRKDLEIGSEMIFFKQSGFSEEEILMYGGEFQYLVMSHLRIYIETSFSEYYTIITLLISYYELLAKYRHPKFRKYWRLAIRRHDKFLKDTYFYKTFHKEYSFDRKKIENKFKNSLGHFTCKIFEEEKFLSDVIYKRIHNLDNSIGILDKQISTVVNSQKDLATMRSSRRLSFAAVILAFITAIKPIISYLMSK